MTPGDHAHVTRQAVSFFMPLFLQEANTAELSICEMPPPRLPQPAYVALAMPTQLRSNICVVHSCVSTNEAPAKPTMKRKMTMGA